MRSLRHPPVAEFHRLAVALLAEREAEHGLLLGVAAAALGAGLPASAYLGAVLDDEAPAAVGLRTTSKLLLSRVTVPGAAVLLAQDALAHLPAPHGVLGPREAVATYAREAERVGRSARAVAEQGIYELRAVIPPRPVAGVRRLATLDDVLTITAWQHASLAAEGHPATAATLEPRVRARVARGEYHLWEREGRPVASAAADLPALTGRRINSVYTPPELRGRGYASALVASLSRYLLDAGFAFTFLHTDLANPTSNGLYQRIGYRPVGEALEVEIPGTGGAARASGR